MSGIPLFAFCALFASGIRNKSIDLFTDPPCQDNASYVPTPQRCNDPCAPLQFECELVPSSVGQCVFPHQIPPNDSDQIQYEIQTNFFKAVSCLFRRFGFSKEIFNIVISGVSAMKVSSTLKASAFQPKSVAVPS